MKTLLVQEMEPLEVFSRLLGPPLAARVSEKALRILVINPGVGSTTLAYFEGLERKSQFTVHIHPDTEDTVDQRLEMILLRIEEEDIDLACLDGIAARGGFVQPVSCGTYPVSAALLEDLANPTLQHASNLGVPIALDLRERAGRDIPVTITDPVVVDEVETVSRMTGLRDFRTDGGSVHYLNHRAVIRLSAWEFEIDPEEASVISAHLGSGVSLLRHHQGRAVRVINAFSGIPSPSRAGSLPIHDLVARLRDKRVSLTELERGIFREGGIFSHAGTNDFRALLDFRDNGATDEQNEKIALVLDFFALKIAEGLLSMASGWGRPDYACLTGGIARSDEFTDLVEAKLGGLMPLVRVPGSLEQESLMAGLAAGLLEPSRLKDYATERDLVCARRNREDHLLDRPVFSKPVRRRRRGSPIRNLEEIVQATRAQVQRNFVPTIAIAGSDNEDALEAARRASAEGEQRIARFILVGDEDKTRRLAGRLDLDLSGDDFRFVAADDPVATCLDLYDGKECHVLMKGSVKTEEILGPTFRWLRDHDRLDEGALFSHVAIFPRAQQGKLLLLTDAGINIAPDLEAKKRILENALFMSRGLDLPRPRVAVISAIEKVNPRIQSSVEAAAIAEEYADRRDCLVEGPLSFDVAVDPEIARDKSYEGEIRGNADILVMPGIDSGNVAYKSLTVSSGLDTAGAIIGCGIPVVLTSRGDTALTKLSSLSLSLRLYFQRLREQRGSAD